MDTAMQTKWLNSEQLAQRWNIDLLKIFEYLQKGLQAYTAEGWRVIDEDRVPLISGMTFEEYLKQNPVPQEYLDSCTCPETPCIEEVKWEQQMRHEYEKLPNRPDVPAGYYPVSFRSPVSYHELMDASARRALLRFKQEDVLEFEQHQPELLHMIEGKQGIIATGEHRGAQQSESTAQNHTIALSFFKSGDHWLIGPCGKEKPLAHLDGFKYIHFLIKSGHPEHLALEVYHLGIIPEGAMIAKMSGHRKLDPEALKAAQGAIKRLDDQMSNEEDPDERCRLQTEIKKYRDYLKDSKYSFESEQKSQRTSVQKAIKRALGKVHDELPSMEQYLNGHTIRTGNFCSYNAPSSPIRWVLEDPHPAI